MTKSLVKYVNICLNRRRKRDDVLNSEAIVINDKERDINRDEAC